MPLCMSGWIEWRNIAVSDCSLLPCFCVDATAFTLCEELFFNQNGHRVALFHQNEMGQTYKEFISPRSQILNQKPELVDC
jgi:hypothetical protein